MTRAASKDGLCPCSLVAPGKQNIADEIEVIGLESRAMPTRMESTNKRNKEADVIGDGEPLSCYFYSYLRGEWAEKSKEGRAFSLTLW